MAAGLLTFYAPFRVGVPSVAVAQLGRWHPRDVIYVDEDGNPVSLDDVKEAVTEAVEAALEDETPRKAVAVQKTADRVLRRLTEARAASQRDIERLRAAIAQSEAALAALDRAIEAQADEEAAIMLILAY